MFTDILTSLITSYKLSFSPKDFTVIKMKDDDEEEIKRYWEEYLAQHYSPDDFFGDSPEELMEKQQAFANPICLDCAKETYSLLTDGENNIISKCPGCKRTYKTHI